MSQDDEARKKELKFELKDYLAIAVAALQTVLLPIVLLLVVILAFAIFLGILWIHSFLILQLNLVY